MSLTWLAGVLGSFGGLCVGAVTTALLLVVSPQLLWKLRRCFRSACPCLELPLDERLPAIPSGDNNYTEIDEGQSHGIHMKLSSLKKANGCKPYEDYSVSPNRARYSSLDDPESFIAGYESYSIKKPEGKAAKAKKEDKSSSHTYFILEPGSDKRIPVKQVQDKTQVLQNDPQHVYFILEPGTNKVTPLSKSGRKLLTEMPDPSYEPVYFVLDPNQGEESKEVPPYAVNDIMAEPAYFILETL